MGEVERQLPGWSQNQVECLGQALISTAACRQVANAQQATPEKTEDDNQPVECLMT